jgi:hypothetical protein
MQASFTYTEEPRLRQEDVNYDEERVKYDHSDYIPSEFVRIAVSHHFKSAKLVLTHSEYHGVYKIKVEDLLDNNIRNWEHNRPPEDIRCEEIARHIYHQTNVTDVIIYLSFNHKDDMFEVIDGIHRLTALRLIKERNSKPYEFTSNNEFGCNRNATWLYQKYVLVNIRFGKESTRGELINAFENINKCQVVPELYIRDTRLEKKEIIENIANEWCHRYKIHFTSSANPNIGHTNRNRFVDLLDRIYDKHNITDANRLKQLLEAVNLQIAMNPPARATATTRGKCQGTGCYLFLYKNDILERMI